MKFKHEIVCRKGRKMCLFLIFFFFPLAVFSAVKGGDIPRPSDGALLFYVDSATYPDLLAKDKAYVEYYYAIPLNQLSFAEKNDTLFAYFVLTTTIRNPQGEEVKRIDMAQRYYALTMDEAQSENPILQNKGFELSPGKYLYHTEVVDGNSQRKGYADGEMEVPNYSVDSLLISQIQFACLIRAPSTDKASPFYKNGMAIIPNVNRTYGYRFPMLYFYFEIHNILASLGKEVDSTKLAISYRVINEQDSVVKIFHRGPQNVTQNTSAEIGGFNIITLPSGRYRLKVDVENTITKNRVSTQRYFQFVGMEREIVEVAPSVEEKGLTEQEAEKYFDQIRYVATKEEKKIYKSLSLDKKITFLKEFWRKRDPTPETEKNEAKTEHYRRWYFVEKRYTSDKPGWKTDRGRIYIKYGPPDEIERHPGGFETKPYEIWYYFQKNMEFYFADLRGAGRYTLVHSVTQDHVELEDPRWERRIRLRPRPEDQYRQPY